LQALAKYPWPGNIRELENMIERAVILSHGPELKVALPELSSHPVVTPADTASPWNMHLDDAERAHIVRALEDANWIVGGPRGAASRLGLNRSTLRSKMMKLGISRPS
jgi:formate hydrogenlyase transcriptional activator